MRMEDDNMKQWCGFFLYCAKSLSTRLINVSRARISWIVLFITCLFSSCISYMSLKKKSYDKNGWPRSILVSKRNGRCKGKKDKSTSNILDICQSHESTKGHVLFCIVLICLQFCRFRFPYRLYVYYFLSFCFMIEENFGSRSYRIEDFLDQRGW